MARRLFKSIHHFITSPGLILLWMSGVAAGFAAMGVGALIVIEGGLFNATASTPHLPIVALAAHTAFIRSVQVRAVGIQPPARFTADEVSAGFRDYDTSCAACHGGPGVARAAWVAGLTPSPPYLEDAARRWRPQELYWIVGQGVKMTGMPAWSESRSNGQVWDLVAFLEALPFLSQADYLRMRAAAQHGSGPGNVRGAPLPDGPIGAPTHR